MYPYGFPHNNRPLNPQENQGAERPGVNIPPRVLLYPNPQPQNVQSQTGIPNRVMGSPLFPFQEVSPHNPYAVFGGPALNNRSIVVGPSSNQPQLTKPQPTKLGPPPQQQPNSAPTFPLDRINQVVAQTLPSRPRLNLVSPSSRTQESGLNGSFQLFDFLQFQDEFFRNDLIGSLNKNPLFYSLPIYREPPRFANDTPLGAQHYGLPRSWKDGLAKSEECKNNHSGYLPPEQLDALVSILSAPLSQREVSPGGEQERVLEMLQRWVHQWNEVRKIVQNLEQSGSLKLFTEQLNSVIAEYENSDSILSQPALQVFVEVERRMKKAIQENSPRHLMSRHQPFQPPIQMQPLSILQSERSKLDQKPQVNQPLADNPLKPKNPLYSLCQTFNREFVSYIDNLLLRDGIQLFYSSRFRAMFDFLVMESVKDGTIENKDDLAFCVKFIEDLFVFCLDAEQVVHDEANRREVNPSFSEMIENMHKAVSQHLQQFPEHVQKSYTDVWLDMKKLFTTAISNNPGISKAVLGALLQRCEEFYLFQRGKEIVNAKRKAG